MHGLVTSSVEVTHISTHGVWVLVDDEEFVLPYDEFPWFRNATVEQIVSVERPTSDHLYWPRLDIDLSIASIKNLEAFPLKAK